MTTLENISRRHSAEISLLNDRIDSRLENGNTLLSHIILSMLRTRGKQLRPLLLIMCAKMFGAVDEKVISAAAAIELLHNASLIHDDVVDNSPERRGRPTVNAVWDNHIAVLVGDFFTSTAMQEAIATGNIQIIDSLCALGKHLTMGELDQIYNAREHNLTIEGYYRIIDYKTASLFVSAASMGCYAVGADDTSRQALEKFAMLFGRCFQIRDDVFDYFPSDLVGKPTGNDLREGKITLPLLYALNATVGDEHDHAAALAAKENLTDDEIASLQKFARDNGGIDHAFDAMHALRSRALDAIDGIGSAEARRELASLFDFIIERQF